MNYPTIRTLRSLINNAHKGIVNYASTFTDTEVVALYGKYCELRTIFASNDDVRFSYVKKSTGEERIARGTTTSEGGTPRTKGAFEWGFPIVPYYDLDKGAWRSFDIVHFRGFISHQ